MATAPLGKPIPYLTPSVTWRQARLMRDASMNAKYAAERKIDQEVARQKHALDLKLGKWFDAQGNLIPEPKGA